MVGYTHNSKTLWRIWHSEFQKMKVQSEVVFGNEKSVHMACQHEGNEFATNMFGLLEDKECIEEIDPGDKPL